ncbi:unnamed protein product [Linum trigynum]|uniref:Uncharacterized protein n=1 Tax=Linum trigynum TaxID=586398 RepID=A0AAV2E5Y8_9ROSI
MYTARRAPFFLAFFSPPPPHINYSFFNIDRKPPPLRRESNAAFFSSLSTFTYSCSSSPLPSSRNFFGGRWTD